MGASLDADVLSATASLFTAPQPGVEQFVRPCGALDNAEQGSGVSPWTEAKATFDVIAQADLQLTATNAPTTEPGKEAMLTFTLKDLDPSLTLGHRISFPLPEGLSLVSAAPLDVYAGSAAGGL